MTRLRAELTFLIAQWKANFASAMEYRMAFVSQVVGMFINNSAYFVFWVVFFDRFKEIRGWGVSDMFLLFAIVATGFGLAFTFFGNAMRLSLIIAEGRLDYYLVLPRSVLLNILASRMSNSAMGDIAFGLTAFLLTGRFTLSEIGLWMISSLLAAVVFVMSFTFFHSLAFWLGNSSTLSEQAANAILTFAMYPADIFQGAVRFLMWTVLPAAFVGAVPLDVVRNLDLNALALLAIAALSITIISTTTFYLGLRRYESGSAINVNV